MAEFKVIDKGGAHIYSDQEGDFYFEIGETVYYLTEFVKTLGNKDYDGVAHISNTGGVGVKIDEAAEYVEYEIFTT